GDIVRLADDYSNGGEGGALYEYLGADGIVDIGREDYDVAARWRAVTAPATIPLAVQASAQDSEITAAGSVGLGASSDATIDAVVEAASVAVSASAKRAGGLSGGGVYSENKIATAVRSFIQYSDAYGGAGEVVVNGGDLALDATDDSDITADAQAASLAASFSGQKAGALSIGLSLAFNTVDNEVAAFIDNAKLVDVDGGIIIGASETGTIDVTAAAASVAVAGASGTAAGLSGGGAVATNVILTDVNAYAEDSTLGDDSTSNTLTFVDIDAVNNSNIDATVAAAAIGGGVSGRTGIGAAIGISLVRNFIGQDPTVSNFDTTQSGHYTTADSLQSLNGGDRIQVVGGARNGEVYEYLGDDVSRFDYVDGQNQLVTKGDLVYVPTLGGIYEYTPGLAGPASVNIQNLTADDYDPETGGDWSYRGDYALDFSDRLTWKQVLDADPGNAAEVQAYLKNTEVTTSGALAIDAQATESIESLALSGAAALGGGGSTGVGVSVAGVLTENQVRTFVKSFIDGTAGIAADSISLIARDSATIKADAGAASIAGGFGGTTGVGVSIGIAVALNEIGNEVEAFIVNADNVTTASGDVVVDARVLPGVVDAATDNSDAVGAQSLAAGDRVEVVDGHTAGGEVGRIYEYRGAVADYVIENGNTDFDGDGYDGVGGNDGNDAADERKEDSVTLHTGNTVQVGSTVYRYLGEDDDIYLGGGYNFGNVLLWEVVDLDSRDLRYQDYSDSKLWELADATISTRAGAASIGASFGSTTGVAVSGAGAVALNRIFTKTNAYIANSDVSSGGNFNLDAHNDASIAAQVAAASVSVGIGGTSGVGASIGISYAQNHIGWDGDTRTPAEVQAFISESTVTASGALTLTADADTRIDALVLAGSAAVAGGGTTGVGVSGAGVISLNKIATDVNAYVDGDDGNALTVDVDGGVTAAEIHFVADDGSAINAIAGAASVAAAFGGTTGVAVSIGVSIAENEIDNDIAAYIADESVGSAATPAGNVIVEAIDNAAIEAISAAASVAIGGGGTAGVAVSGAGAFAQNVILTRTNAYVLDSELTSSGNVDLDATSTSSISAIVAAASAAVGVGGTAGVGASVGASIARNYIGWNPHDNSFDPSLSGHYTSDDGLRVLAAGDQVQVNGGARNGDVYEYIGDNAVRYQYQVGVDNGATISEGDVVYVPGEGGLYRYAGSGSPTLGAGLDFNDTGDSGDWVFEGTNVIDFGDTGLWELVLAENPADAAQVRAFVENSDISASGDLTVDADADEGIEALTFAGSVAIGGGGTAGIALAGSGVGVENRIRTDIEAFVDGDGSNTIEAHDVRVSAHDDARIDADALAVSIAGSAAGTVGVSLSVGIAASYNEVSNTVDAFIRDIDSLSASGDVVIDARVLPGEADAASYDSSDGQQSLNDGDRVEVLSGHTDGGEVGRIYQYRAFVADYSLRAGADFDGNGVVNSDDEQTIYEGNTVELADGRIFRYVGTDADDTKESGDFRLDQTSYTSANGWAQVTQPDLRDLSSENYADTSRWELADGSITARVAAASVAATFGGVAGIALAGAGAVADNVILTKVNAYIQDSNIDSAVDVDIYAENAARIIAGVAAVSVSIGGGGTVGAGASVGVSIAHNKIGFDQDDKPADAEIRAYISDSSILASGALSADAINSARIDAFVLAASASIAGGGVAGIGLSGSGVDTTNRISMDVMSFIDGDGSGGIIAESLALSADDTSKVSATAASVSLAAGFAGTVGVSISIGVALAENTISNNVWSYIVNADTGVVATGGDVSVEAVEDAAIDADAVAASFSVAIGGIAGVALSGAGADATNIINNVVRAYIDDSNVATALAYDFISSQTVTGLEPGQRILLVQGASGLLNSGSPGDFYEYIGPATPATYDSSADGLVTLAAGDTVRVGSTIYQFVGDPDRVALTRDLGSENFDTADWAENVVNLGDQNYLNLGLDAGDELWLAVDGPESQNIVVDAQSTSSIESLVGAISGAVGGGTVGVAGSVGASFGRNLIGQLKFDHEESDGIAQVLQGERVKTASGEVFEFVGAKPSDENPGDPADGVWVQDADGNDRIVLNLASGAQNYAANSLWRSLGSGSGNEVSAYVTDSTLFSAGDVVVHAEATETVSATVFAGSVAISAGLVAVSVAGAGVSAVNEIGTTVHAFVDNSTVMGSGNLDISALSDSRILDSTAVAGAVSIAAGIGGGLAVAVTLVDNSIMNDVQAYIGGMDGDFVAVGGHVTVHAEAENARIERVEAVGAAVSGGLVAASGVGVDIDSTIDNNVEANIHGDIDVSAMGMTPVETGEPNGVAVEALEDAYIYGDSSAVSVALGLGVAAGVGQVRNVISSRVQARIANARVNAPDITVYANSRAEIPVTTAVGIAAGLYAININQANAVIATTVDAFIDGAELDASGTVTVNAVASNFARAAALGDTIGLIAAGGMNAAIEVGSDGVDDVQARLGNDTLVQAGSLAISAQSNDDLFAESVAASVGLYGIAGALSSLVNNNSALTSIGDDSDIAVDSFSIRSVNTQDFDTRADSVAVGLAAGAGAGASNDINNKAKVVIGNASVVSDSIQIVAVNSLSKSRVSDLGEHNLDAGSAGLGAVSILQSNTTIDSDALIDLSGANLTVLGSNENAGIFQVEASNSITAMDSVRIESVSGFSVSAALSKIDANPDARINVTGAELENRSGDVYLATKANSELRPSNNLFAAAALSGVASADVTALNNVSNAVTITDSTIKGNDIYVFTGRNVNGETDRLEASGNAEILAASLGPNIVVPIVTATITETNMVTVAGNSALKALEDVNLVANTGIGGGMGRATTDGMALSLSFVPYGMEVPDGASDTTNNDVVIAPGALIEAGINNKSLVHVLPVTVDGVQQFDPADIGRALTPAELQDLGLDPGLKYEYGALNLDEITFGISTGTVVQVVPGAHAGAASTEGNYYEYLPETDDGSDQILLEKENYGNVNRWRFIDYANLSTDQQDALTVYQSDATLNFKSDLDGKFYVIKPAELEAPTLAYVNVGNLLLDQRNQVLQWMTSHATDAEAIARYQVQLDEIDKTLDDLGLLSEEVDPVTGDTVTLVKRELDTLILNIPSVYAAPGSVFIEVDGLGQPSSPEFTLASAGYQALVADNKLIARAGAKIDIFNQTPFTMTVNDAIVRDNKRIEIIDGDYTVFEPGNVYLNVSKLTNASDDTPPVIDIVQDSFPTAKYDLGSLEFPGLDQDINVVGDVINENGDLTINNVEGSIVVSGDIRAEQINILAAKDFALNTDGWFHTNQDPRQYIDYDQQRAKAVTQSALGSVFTPQMLALFDLLGLPLPATPLGYVAYGVNSESPIDTGLDELDVAITRDESRILAQGTIAITARYLNVNGLIQSGVDTIGLTIDADFDPGNRTVNFTDGNGNTLDGIHFGDGVPVDGYFDPGGANGRGAIVVEDIIPEGGRIIIAGQILSTGNGRLKVANGYTSLDIDNLSSYELVLQEIDTTTRRVGEIIIVDTGRTDGAGNAQPQKDIYTLDGDNIFHRVLQGSLVSLNTTVAVVTDVTKVRHLDTVYLYKGPNANLLLPEQDYTDTALWQPTGDNAEDFVADDLDNFNSVGAVPVSGEGTASTVIYSEVDSNTITGLDAVYEVRDDLLYTWVEGQDKTQTTITKYEKKSFNLFGDNAFADLLVADSSYKWRDIKYTDKQPLLESETLEVAGTAGAPVYAAGTAYTIDYQEERDTSVTGVTNVTHVRDGGTWYKYVGIDNANLELPDQDYGDTNNWVVDNSYSATQDPDPDIGFNRPELNQYLSSFQNKVIDGDTWTTGGGWLRKKTVHTKITEVVGLKDVYTHTLKADYPIAISFIQGPDTPSIDIYSAGNIFLQADIESPTDENGTPLGSISLTSGTGSVTSADKVAIYGATPTISAGTDVDVIVEGDKGALDVTAGGDIRVAAVSLDNVSSILQVGSIASASGNVMLFAPNGIESAGGSITGERIELFSKAAAIGSAVNPILVNSDIDARTDTGGLAARADGDIFIVESVGDMKLVDPVSFGAAEGEVIAAIHSLNGDVTLAAAAGSILDGSVETFRPGDSAPTLEFVDLSEEQKDAVRNDGLSFEDGRFYSELTANEKLADLKLAISDLALEFAALDDAGKALVRGDTQAFDDGSFYSELTAAQQDALEAGNAFRMFHDLPEAQQDAVRKGLLSFEDGRVWSDFSAAEQAILESGEFPVAIGGSEFPLSPALMLALFPQTDFLIQNPTPDVAETANVIGANITLLARSGDGSVGRITGAQEFDLSQGWSSLSAGQKEILTLATPDDIFGVNYPLYKFVPGNAANVDLSSEDFTDSGRWQAIATDYMVGFGTVAEETVEVLQGQTVLVQFSPDQYGLYQSLSDLGTVNLRTINYGDTGQWLRLTSDQGQTAIAGFGTDADGPVDLVAGDIVLNKTDIQSLVLQLWDDVNVDASVGLTVEAGKGVAVEAVGDLKLDLVQSAGDAMLAAAGDITDLGSGDAAVTVFGDLTLIAGGSVGDTSGSGSLRVQLLPSGELKGSAGTEMRVEQSAGPVTLFNGEINTISDLNVAGAHAGDLLKIDVYGGDMRVSGAGSDGDIRLEAHGSNDLIVSPNGLISAADQLWILADEVLSSLGSRVETTADGSLLDIDALTTINIFGVIEALGAGSHADLDAGTVFTLAQGGIASVRDLNALLEIDAADELIISSGSAVLAGAEFDSSTGTPVPVKLADGADAVLTSAHELTLKGTVTTSDRMELNAGPAVQDKSAEFLPLGPDHYLAGTTSYGILLTGTLTTLAPDSELVLAAADPIVIRGNINTRGDGSDLLIRSDDWVYYEGFTEVEDQVRIYGGFDTGLNSTGGVDSKGNSVFVDTVSRINTFGVGSSVEIVAARDVEVAGSVVAGGTVGPGGVAWVGDGASAILTAGEQVYLNTGLLASGTVQVTGGTPGADDDELSVVIDTAGGLYSAGLAADGSSGGHVEVQAAANLEIMGNLVSGANVTLEFDSSNNLIGKTFDWSAQASDVLINAAGQAYIGGHTVNTGGAPIETGGYIYANDRIDIVGGSHPSGVGVLVHAASEIVTQDPDSSVEIQAAGDADIQGVILAGGEILQQRDAGGNYQGRDFVDFGGDSSISITADEQITVGTELRAGKTVDLVGGSDDSGTGLVLYGSAHVETWAADSSINLNAPGRVDILAPAHAQEILADGFAPTADGKLPAGTDVTLNIVVDLVDSQIRASVSLPASETADNTEIAHLVGDLQAALENASWTEVGSGDDFTDFASDPDLGGLPVMQMKLRDGKLLFTSAYQFDIDPSSLAGNAAVLGLTQLAAGTAQSSLRYSLEAPGPGSTVNIGSPAGPNEKLYIAGKVLAGEAINLYSGTASDGIDVDLDFTGHLETIDGSIAFTVGEFGDVKGTIIAGGADSDVSLSAVSALVIRGEIRASHDINLTTTSAGLVHTDLSTRVQESDDSPVIDPGLIDGTTDGKLAQDERVSVYIDDTANLGVTGTDGGVARNILVSGNDAVVMNGVIGLGAGDVDVIDIGSVAGNLYLTHTSGRVVTDAQAILRGQTVHVDGVVQSVGVTDDPDDWEIEIDAADTALISADIDSVGSVLISAGQHVPIFDTDISVTGAGEKLRIVSGNTIKLGEFGVAQNHPVFPDGQDIMLGSVINATGGVELDAQGHVEITSGVKIAVSEDNSLIRIDADSLEHVGTLLGGAQTDGETDTWSGEFADVEINATGPVTFGGNGYDDTGALVAMGGAVEASGEIRINITGTQPDDTDFTLSAESFLRTDSIAGGAFAGAAASHIDIDTSGGINLYGLIEALDPVSTLDINADGLLTLDGIVRAEQEVNLFGGDDPDDPADPVDPHGGLVVTPLIVETDSLGNPLTLIDINGTDVKRPIDANGFLIDGNTGDFVDLNGDPIGQGDPPVFGGDPIRISGGIIETGVDGRINLGAEGDVFLLGVVGKVEEVNGLPTVEVSEIDISSNTGTVFVEELVNSRDLITISGNEIQVLDQALVKTRFAGSEIYLEAEDAIFVERSQTTLDRARVDSASLVHFYGGEIRIDGVVVTQEFDSRIVLNAVDDVTIAGQVTSGGDIEINAGVDPALTQAESEAAGFALADLISGNLLITGEAVLDATGEVVTRAADDVQLVAYADLGDPRSVANPTIVTNANTVQVVTGSRQVEDGITSVSETNWVPTTVTEQVGTEEVVVGSVYHTMDVVLAQDGYYNPDAPAGEQVREYFIEGIDYFNLEGFFPTSVTGSYSSGGSLSNSDLNRISGAPDDRGIDLKDNITVVYDFSANPITDRSGMDFNVYEEDSGVIEFGDVVVYVSNDGMVWKNVNNTAGAALTLRGDEVHGSSSYARGYDIAGTGLSEANFVKLVGIRDDFIDLGFVQLGDHGFDLDGVGTPLDYWGAGGAPADGTTFEELDPLQKQALLDYLGYEPLYHFNFSNAKEHKTIDGIPTTKDWTPEFSTIYGNWSGFANLGAVPPATLTAQLLDEGYVNTGANGDYDIYTGPLGETQTEYWVSSTETLERTRTVLDAADIGIFDFEIDGWNDKYIRMPVGAEQDVLRVVSQGSPDAWNENVGSYNDSARVLYTQINSAFTGYNSTYYRGIDADNSPARWQVSYYDSGLREYQIIDGRTGPDEVSKIYIPDWQSAVLDTSSTLQDSNGTLIYAPVGYTAGLTGPGYQQYGSPRLVDVGDWEELLYNLDVNWYDTTFSINTEIGAEEEWARVWAWTENSAGTKTSDVEYDSKKWPGGGDGYPTIYTLNRNLLDTTVSHNDKLFLQLQFIEEDAWPNPDDNIGTDRESYAVTDLVNGGKYYLYVSDGSYWGDSFFQVFVSTTWTKYADTYENFYDYLNDWTSTPTTLQDNRLTLNYQWVSDAEDVTGLRPRYETYETEVPVVTERQVTKWRTELIYEDQTVFTTERVFEDPTESAAGVFTAESIIGRDAITILAGNDVDISGKMLSDGASGSITIHADNNTTIEGTAPLTDPDALAAISELKASSQISISSGGSTRIADSGRLTVDDGGIGSTSDISLTAGTDVFVEGELFS
ncbi:MAG: hypothetical protein PVJ78_00250, partial [Gammaproteobacteria bacterium]